MMKGKWSNPLFFRYIPSGDMAKCAEALPFAKQKLAVMVKSGSPKGTEFIAGNGAKVHVSTYPNLIRIASEGGVFVTYNDFRSAIGGHPDATITPYQRFLSRKLFLNNLVTPTVKNNFYAGTGFWYKGNQALSWHQGTLFFGGRYNDTTNAASFIKIYAACFTQVKFLSTTKAVIAILATTPSSQTVPKLGFYTYFVPGVATEIFRLTQLFGLTASFPDTILKAGFLDDGYTVAYLYSKDQAHGGGVNGSVVLAKAKFDFASSTLSFADLVTMANERATITPVITNDTQTVTQNNVPVPGKSTDTQTETLTFIYSDSSIDRTGDATLFDIGFDGQKVFYLYSVSNFTCSGTSTKHSIRKDVYFTGGFKNPPGVWDSGDWSASTSITTVSGIKLGMYDLDTNVDTRVAKIVETLTYTTQGTNSGNANASSGGSGTFSGTQDAIGFFSCGLVPNHNTFMYFIAKSNDITSANSTVTGGIAGNVQSGATVETLTLNRDLFAANTNDNGKVPVYSTTHAQTNTTPFSFGQTPFDFLNNSGGFGVDMQPRFQLRQVRPFAENGKVIAALTIDDVPNEVGHFHLSGVAMGNKSNTIYDQAYPFDDPNGNDISTLRLSVTTDGKEWKKP